MKAKDEAFNQFREFRSQVENKTCKNIKVLRLDNGGEFTSNDFKYFCKEAGIKRELTVSYNPQQNGVAERKKHSIIAFSRDMIHDQEFPMFLWLEACNMVLYVQNMSPHRILGEKTLEEEFSRVKPDIGHLRIFGCQFYIHTPLEKRMKLDPLGQKGIFLGYSETSKDYRIFIPMQRKILVSRDVNFKENLIVRDLTPHVDIIIHFPCNKGRH
jgi:hypothetical protein